jgi:TolB-like protein
MNFRTTTAMMFVASVVLLLAGCKSVDTVQKPGYNFGQITRTAVVDVSGDLRGKQTKDQVASFIQMELMRNGYGVVERQKVNEVLKEQEFQRGGATQAADAARAGRILNVPAVVMSTMRVKAERVDMTMKMIDVETAELVWMGEASGKTHRTLATAGGAIAGAAGGALLGGDRTGQVVGGVLGGAAGGGAGYLLTPDEAKMVRGLVKKIGQQMPRGM